MSAPVYRGWSREQLVDYFGEHGDGDDADEWECVNFDDEPGHPAVGEVA